jgi:hypothetical protein
MPYAPPLCWQGTFNLLGAASMLPPPPLPSGSCCCLRAGDDVALWLLARDAVCVLGTRVTQSVGAASGHGVAAQAQGWRGNTQQGQGSSVCQLISFALCVARARCERCLGRHPCVSHHPNSHRAVAHVGAAIEGLLLVLRMVEAAEQHQRVSSCTPLSAAQPSITSVAAPAGACCAQDTRSSSVNSRRQPSCSRPRCCCCRRHQCTSAGGSNAHGEAGVRGPVSGWCKRIHLGGVACALCCCANHAHG